MLSEEEIVNINKSAGAGGVMPVQEKGIRPACAVPYQLYADGQLSTDKKTVAIKFTAGSEIFAAKSAGSPFYVYANTGNDLKVRSYAVSAGDSLTDSWTLDDFAGNNYHLSLYGPNGFFREFKGGIKDPQVTINIEYSRLKTDKKKLTGNIEIIAVNNSTGQLNTIVITDNAYKSGNHTLTPGTNSKQANLILDLSKSFGWYDFTVKVKGNNTFEKRYAGHVETGNSSFTDPFMGGIV